MALSCSSLLLLLLLIFAQYSLQQTCYFPSGAISTGDLPCLGLNGGANTVVPCCPPDRQCMPNKMCQGSKSDGNPSRASCTDQTWGSADCPQFCTKYHPGAMIFDCTARSGITNANNNRFYCCAGDSPQCCSNQSLLFIADKWDFSTGSLASSAASSSTTSSTTSSASSTPSTSSTTSSSTTTSTTSSSTTSSSTTSTPSSSSSSSSSTTLSSTSSSTTLSSITTKANIVSTTTVSDNEKSTTSTSTSATSLSTTASETHSSTNRDWTGVGIGVGVGVAVPLLALAIVGPILWRRHRKKLIYELGSPQIYPHDSASSRSASTRKEPLVRIGKPANLYEAGGVASYELDAYAGVVELPMKSPKSPRELPGSEGERQRYRAYRPTN